MGYQVTNKTKFNVYGTVIPNSISCLIFMFKNAKIVKRSLKDNLSHLQFYRFFLKCDFTFLSQNRTEITLKVKNNGLLRNFNQSIFVNFVLIFY